MSSVILPLDVYEALESGLGKERARTVVKAIETAIDDRVELQWKSSENGLLEKMEKRFVTKDEFRLEMKLLEAKMKLYFFILLFSIFLTNPKAVDIIVKLLHLNG